jgi:hypothetical protein
MSTRATIHTWSGPTSAHGIRCSAVTRPESVIPIVWNVGPCPVERSVARKPNLLAGRKHEA